MATQIIMDLNGDTRHNFDAKDVKALLEAERRFNALTGAGFTAATRTASGEPVVTRTFDPRAGVNLRHLEAPFVRKRRQLRVSGHVGSSAGSRELSEVLAAKGWALGLPTLCPSHQRKAGMCAAGRA